MEGRKLALILCVAASCAGCVTESKTIEVPPEAVAKLKNVKPEEPVKRDALPNTWVAFGRLRESQANNDKLAPAQQSACREEARQAYQKALEIDPKHIDAYVALGTLYSKQEDFDRAIVAMQRGVQLNPKSARLYYEIGLCYLTKKDFANAMHALGRAHELEPDNREVAIKYGLCLARGGRPEEAVKALSSVMNRAEANYNVARMMLHIQQPELARQYVEMALHERSNHEASLRLLAQLDAGPAAESPVRQASFGGLP